LSMLTNKAIKREEKMNNPTYAGLHGAKQRIEGRGGDTLGGRKFLGKSSGLA
jgi:hypothetical protein